MNCVRGICFSNETRKRKLSGGKEMKDNSLFPAKGRGSSKAGVKIHLDLLEDETEPFDITLCFNRPKVGGDEHMPLDENSFTATGKLIFKFGERCYVEFFGENTKVMDEELLKQREEI
jgi:hypothetical protein